MYEIKARIKGVAPILFNHWTDASRGQLGSGATGGTFTDDQRMKEAMEKVYYREGVGLYLPGWNLKKCIVEGAGKANLKEGKKAMGPFLTATVFVDGDPAFGREQPDEIHETTGRRPPRTGGACLIKRPMLRAGWELPFTLTVVDDRRSADHIRKALEEAGLLVGLGDWRPEYGRFIVTDWKDSRING